ncbi:hypothetical protein [Kosakonia sp. YIM B13611]|uniref:hypothetical protein n=1 Tax=unclassified Kosakonia TaxID=2632876 RepID=UPI003699A7F1
MLNHDLFCRSVRSNFIVIPFIFAAIKSQWDAYGCQSSIKNHAHTLSGWRYMKTRGA